MAITLNNSQIKLRIETPGEKYRGSRFDWNGTITQIWYKGKKMLAGEKMLFHRNDRIYGRGLHNEFGIKNCIGYDDIPVGEYFPKIGTGWLKKDEKPYFFFTQYKLDVLDFSWQKVSDTKAVFMCDSGIRNGYGYRYTKPIEIIDNTFTVSYNLENVGEKKISTTEYIHNFLLTGNMTKLLVQKMLRQKILSNLLQRDLNLKRLLMWNTFWAVFLKHVKTRNFLKTAPGVFLTVRMG